MWLKSVFLGLRTSSSHYNEILIIEKIFDFEHAMLCMVFSLKFFFSKKIYFNILYIYTKIYLFGYIFHIKKYIFNYIRLYIRFLTFVRRSTKL